jgi:hypothetical protein
MTQRPDRSTQFLNAGQALRREFIDIDLIKDQSNKQLADLSIPVGIVGLLRRYIYDFKVWRRSSFRSQVTPQYQLTTSSRPAAKLVLKQKLDTDRLAQKSVDSSRFIDIDDLDETQSVDYKYMLRLRVEEELT